MHMTSDHPTDLDLVAFIDDELPEPQRAGVTAHTRACAACESRVIALRESAAQIDRLLGHSRAGGTAPQRQRLQHALRGMHEVTPAAPSALLAGGFGGTQWLQVAAIALVACGLWSLGASMREMRIERVGSRNRGRDAHSRDDDIQRTHGPRAQPQCRQSVRHTGIKKPATGKPVAGFAPSPTSGAGR